MAITRALDNVATRMAEPVLKNRLKEARTEAGLTQAERISVSRKTINTVENGVFVPSTILALKLSKASKQSLHANEVPFRMASRIFTQERTITTSEGQ